MKTDRSRSEMLTQPGTMPQKRTDWKLLRSKTYPRFKLVTQEKKHPIGTMPMSTGIRDPRDGTRGACRAPRVQRATRTSRPKEGLRRRRQATQTTRQHRHRLELPCPAHASVVPRSNLLPLAAQKGLFLDSPLPYAKLQNPSLQFPTSSPAPRARSPALVPQLSCQRAGGLNPSWTKKNHVG